MNRYKYYEYERKVSGGWGKWSLGHPQGATVQVCSKLNYIYVGAFIRIKLVFYCRLSVFIYISRQ